MNTMIAVALLFLMLPLISVSAGGLVEVAGNLSVTWVDMDTTLTVLTDADLKTCHNFSEKYQLKIDLGEPRHIVQFEINAAGAQQGLMLDVETSLNESSMASFCQEVNRVGRFSCTTRVTAARFIWIKSRSTVMLCEIRAFECKVGRFGENCSRSCHCESSEHCNKETGSCGGQACLAGWKGADCQTACDEGTFGSSCGQTCHCADDYACNIINGTCPAGCALKWYDPACQTAYPKLSGTPVLYDHFPTQLLINVPATKTFFNSTVFALVYKTFVKPHLKGVEEGSLSAWTFSGSSEHSKDTDSQLVYVNNLHWNTQYHVKIEPTLVRKDMDSWKFERGLDEVKVTTPAIVRPKSRGHKHRNTHKHKHKTMFKGGITDSGSDYDQQTESNVDDLGNETGDVIKGNSTFGINVNRSGLPSPGDDLQVGDAGEEESNVDEVDGGVRGDEDYDEEEEEDGSEGGNVEVEVDDDERNEIVGEAQSLLLKTSCKNPEAPNVTSVESWVDERNDVVISVSWTPLTASQSNCDRISVYFIYYKKFEDLEWRDQTAESNSSSKNLTGADIENNSQYILRVSSKNNMNLHSFSETWRIRTLGKESTSGADAVGSDAASSPGLVSTLVVVLVALVIISIVLIIVMNKRRLKMMKGERSVPDSAILLKKSGYSVPMQNGSVVLEEDFEVSVMPWKNQGDQNKKSKAKAKPRVIRPPIKCEDLENFVKERSENNFEELRKEYKEIPEGNAEATTIAGLKMDNRLKNRFINIIPYDHSRVVLDLVEGDLTSDYINANYIDGYNKPKFYIAAQGCNKWSVQDIWRMLWQENSLRIVVLTNLVEKGRPKCEQYWPDQIGEEKSYGDLGVTLTSVESSASHVVRSFTVHKCIEAGYKSKTDHFGTDKTSGGSLKKLGSKKTSPDKPSSPQMRENSSDADLKKAERESLLAKNGDINKENCVNDVSKRNGSIGGRHEGTIYENCKVRSTDLVSNSGENIYANVDTAASDGPEAWIEETREVKQFHFTSWPDHGVPYHTTPLIAFRNKVRKHDQSHPGPIIVHCSAGVGRSGTFIALDYLLEQAEAEKRVDLHGLTHNMRLDRCNMIQTVEQYIFVYETLIEAMKTKSSLINLSDFETRYKELMTSSGDPSKNGLTTQFDQLLEARSKLHSDVNCDARLPLNVCKNRNSSILPDDNHRPYLMTNVEGTNDYINAVFLDSYRRQNSIILTQMPLLNTVIDLWRMVRDHKCSAIIMVNHFDAADETAAQYWPEENEECECGPFLIETLSTDREDSDIVVRQLQLNYFPDLLHKTDKQSSSANSPPVEAAPGEDGQPGEGHEHPSEVHHVTHLQLLNWSPHSNLLSSELPLIRLVEKIDEVQKKNPDQPIVVHCLDGASQSGLLVSSVCVWERMKDELEVDVYETVKRLQSIRPQIVDNVEQYSYLYKLILLYLREFATYSNFN